MCDMKPFGELSDAEKGALLLAQHEGKKILKLHWGSLAWWTVERPLLDEGIYRIAPEPLIPDSIDWSHVAPEWKFMARNGEGNTYLFCRQPMMSTHGDGWILHGFTTVKAFASYRRGTVDWRDSLVRRPS